MGIYKDDLNKALEIVNNLKPKERQGFNKKVSVHLITKWLESEYHYLKSRGYDLQKITTDLNEYELNKCGIISHLSTYKAIKKALIKGKLVLNCKSNNGIQWDVKYLVKNDISGIGLITLKSLCGYRLNYETGYYHINCYGTSRPLEIILAFGYNLGLKFGKIRQNQKIFY